MRQAIIARRMPPRTTRRRQISRARSCADRDEILHEPRLDLEFHGRPAVQPLLNFTPKRLKLFVFRDVAAHGLADDLAGGSELAGFDLAAGEFHERLA